MNDRTHVRRIFTVLGVALTLAFIVQRLLQPQSFGKYGHYRADSLQLIMSQEPAHQSRPVCAECHLEINEVHQKDIHAGVQCEDCHGPGYDHVRYYREKDDEQSGPPAVMPTEYTLEGCLFCHRKLAARPSTFAQIELAEHYEFLHVTDLTTPCIECHSPHEPLFLLESVSEARIHPVIFECEDCHETVPDKDHKQVQDHPTIFVCQDCHPSVVRDFKKHEHSFLRCTTCHLFYREEEFSGRVFQNGNRRFCLLCHERKPFKDPEQMPQIEFDLHIEQQAPVMRRPAGPLLSDPSACLQCHFDYIHDPDLIRRLQEQER